VFVLPPNSSGKRALLVPNQKGDRGSEIIIFIKTLCQVSDAHAIKAKAKEAPLEPGRVSQRNANVLSSLSHLHPMNQQERAICADFCCAHCVLLVVGFPMWLVGCNPDLRGGCLTKDAVLGNITSVSISGGQCCNSDDTGCYDNDYSCCRSTVYASVPGGTCHYQAGIQRNCSVDIGSQVSLVWDPRTHKCLSATKSFRIWISGVIILCADAFLWLVQGGRYLLHTQCNGERRAKFLVRWFNAEPDLTRPLNAGAGEWV
jgi:hypothetical protein